MTPTKVYHIYAGSQCICHSIKEEDFKDRWNSLKGMVGLLHTDYQLEDLTYEEVEVTLQKREEQSY